MLGIILNDLNRFSNDLESDINIMNNYMLNNNISKEL